jgi:hypothetical protein
MRLMPPPPMPVSPLVSNPWKSRPLAICATPIVGIMLQVILLGYGTVPPARGLARSAGLVEVGLIALVLALTLSSIPALTAAVAGIRTREHRAWNLAGAFLNSAYFLLVLLVATLTLATHLVNLR